MKQNVAEGNINLSKNDDFTFKIQYNTSALCFFTSMLYIKQFLFTQGQTPKPIYARTFQDYSWKIIIPVILNWAEQQHQIKTNKQKQKPTIVRKLMKSKDLCFSTQPISDIVLHLLKQCMITITKTINWSKNAMMLM